MTPENNQDEIATLKNQVFILLVCLIAVTGTLTAALYRQASMANKDIAQMQRVSGQMHTNEMVIGAFVGRLATYAQKHPDFLPVLKKNGIIPQPGAATAAPAAAAPPAAGLKK